VTYLEQLERRLAAWKAHAAKARADFDGPTISRIVAQLESEIDRLKGNSR